MGGQRVERGWEGEVLEDKKRPTGSGENGAKQTQREREREKEGVADNRETWTRQL